MKKNLLLILLFLPSLTSLADNTYLYQELEATMNRDSVYTAARESQISQLKTVARFNQNNTESLLKAYDAIFEAYYAYKYDSAMVYVQRSLTLATRRHHHYYLTKNKLHRALLLASIGFYKDAEDCLQSIEQRKLPSSLLYEYFFTRYKLYSFWSNYYSGSEFQDKLKAQISSNLQQAIPHAPRHSSTYYFLMGEWYENRHEIDKAMATYHRVLKSTGTDNPLYGSAAYNLANCYLWKKDTTSYETYLLRAAIIDIKCAVKENTALQDLAMFIYKQEGHLDDAEKYITFSSKDAQLYNSRLRMFGIAKRLPAIVSAYQKQQTANNRRLTWVTIAISILSVVLCALVFSFLRQNKQLSMSRKLISANNRELEGLNAEINQQNKLLLDINLKREKLAKVYIDICARYIYRIKNFRTLVQRKIKANQAKDLLSRLTDIELSSEEADEFLTHFDKAFLDLYPTFIDEVNLLLKDDCQMPPAKKAKMTTEQRVLALIRLGVKDSAEIANLLFYSPQTIYNYRWGIKGKAKNKETFEEEVIKLCQFR